MKRFADVPTRARERERPWRKTPMIERVRKIESGKRSKGIRATADP